MRAALTISVTFSLLGACHSLNDEPNSHDLISSEWQLVEMKGMEKDFEVPIPDGFIKVGPPANWNNLKFWTTFDPKTNRIVGNRFSGCNGAYNSKAETFENKWGHGLRRRACTTLMQRVDGTGPILETSASFNSLGEYSESRFLELAPQIAGSSVDWDAKTFTYLDADGQQIMKFKRAEAAE